MLLIRSLRKQNRIFEKEQKGIRVTKVDETATNKFHSFEINIRACLSSMEIYTYSSPQFRATPLPTELGSSGLLIHSTFAFPILSLSLFLSFSRSALN